MKKGMLKTQSEIQKLAEGGQLLKSILKRTSLLVKPGVSTKDLSEFAEQEIRKVGGVPSFIGYGPKGNEYKDALCTSVNDVVVHGMPSTKTVLSEGDIIGLDIGMVYKGLFTDTAITVPVGQVSSLAQKLIATTKESLDMAIAKALPGNTIGDIAFATQNTAETAGFSVIRDLVGHGVGYAVHEDPAVPNYGKPGQGIKLQEGLVIAIEPMLCQWDYHIYFDDDGWTIRTEDGGLSAHFEHTIAITKNGPVVLT